MLDYEIIYIATNTIFTFAIYLLFHTFFKEEYNRKTEKLSYLFYFASSSVLTFITKVPLITMIFTLTFLFIISLNYESSMQKKVIFSSLIYAILFVIEIIVSVSIGFIDILAVHNSTFNSVVGLILIRTITLIVAYLLNRYKNSRKKDFPIPQIYYLALTVILFGTLYLFVISLENNNLTLYNVLISGSILIIVNVTMIVIDEKIYNSFIVMNEKNILKQQNIAYENQAEIINQSTESIKSLKHDIKNHLIMLDEMYKNDKKDEVEPYIRKILKEIDNGAFSQSNNFVIDSIINFKLRKLQNTDTKIYLDISVPQLINIFAYDITVILGNLLDNAITAILQSENKKIDLQISYSMGNLIILIDNSFDGKLIIENGKFKTTKSFKVNHGIGLANIEKSLESYGGEIRTEYTSDTFSVAVIVPYKN